MATQDPNIPAYNKDSGLLTDYGRSLGLKEVNAPKNNSSTGDPFLSAIQDKLIKQAGVVSSTNSNLENRLKEAMAGVSGAAKKTGEAIASQYDREIAFQGDKAGLDIQNHLEGRSGFATQMVGFRSLVETTDKNLKDLEQRKQEALLLNDAGAASKIADMQFQALEFRQKAEQEVFSNLLGIANFGIQSVQEKRLMEQQTFQEKSTMSNIALQYGLDIKPGDTLDSITNKAMVFASEEQKANLAKVNAEIKYTNAQTAKILAGDKDAKTVKITPQITDKLAARWNQLVASGLSIDTSKEMESIYAKFVGEGKEDQLYDAIAKTTKEQAKSMVEETKKASSPKPNAFDLFTAKLFGEKPAGWQQLPDGTWRKL